MNIKKTIIEIRDSICTTENFEGESIEEKTAKITETNAPIEAISPMIYTERKDGVQAEYDIRADKWDIAQNAMDSIGKARQERRQKKSSSEEAPTNSTDNLHKTEVRN